MTIPLWGILVEAGILLYLLYKGRFPARIIVSYDYQCIWAIWGSMLAYLDNKQQANNKIRVLSIICLLSLIGNVFVSADNIKETIEVRRTNVRLYMDEMDYLRQYPD